ncbi:hypothetical protein EDE04_7019 [Streptomyces sp. 2132.2]|nr:hypothetical protein EDE04_7019 [Streptomyces sp. 2132.2]
MAASPPAAAAADGARAGVQIPAGWGPVDVPPTELRVGGQVLAGGRLPVAQRTVRVYRPAPADRALIWVNAALAGHAVRSWDVTFADGAR